MLHRILIAVYTVIAIPWYWSLTPSEWAMTSVLGLPLWVFASTVGSLGVSIHTAMIFLKPWECEGAENGNPIDEAGP